MDITFGDYIQIAILIVGGVVYVVTSRMQIQTTRSMSQLQIDSLKEVFSKHESQEYHAMNEVKNSLKQLEKNNDIGHAALHTKANDLAIQVAAINAKIGNGSIPYKRTPA